MYNNNDVVEAYHYVCQASLCRVACSESSIIRSWQVLKKRFTESASRLCGIAHRFIHPLYDVWSAELQVQFCPQISAPQLLKDVVSKNANE